MRGLLTDVLASGRVLLMDGAMGTELLSGAPARSIHRAYVEAGAEVLLTNTFQTNPVTLGNSWERVCIDAIEMAREEAGHSRFVLFDAGPIFGSERIEFEDESAWRRIVTLVRRQAEQLDGFLIETCSTEAALRAAEVAREAGLPVLLSLWFRRDTGQGYLSDDGRTPEWFAERVEGLAALGVNCGPAMNVSDCAAVLRRYRTASTLPLFARPNAGTPEGREGRWYYAHSPESMAGAMPLLLAAGAGMVGGCCGTTPAHIRAFREVIPGE